MKEKNFDTNLTLAFSVFTVFLIFLSFFIYLSIRADTIYSKLDFMNKPAITSVKLDYYRGVLALVSQALQYNSSNASYWERKADYLVGAFDDGFKEPLAINNIDIENLYRKAINLNPTDYKCHLKLGWFCANNGNKELAKNELLKAIELHPTNFQTYLYLGKYYIKIQDEKNAFNNILLALHYGSRFYWDIFNSLKEDSNNLKAITFNDREQEIKYVIFPLAEIFNFKSQEFPHKQIPLKIRVYAKRPVSAITLNYNGIIFRHLPCKKAAPEYDVYELNLDEYPLYIYLDDLQIITAPSSAIEKIEFIYKF
jgi:tetratricopeptide (TPR) repeat protein